MVDLSAIEEAGHTGEERSQDQLLCMYKKLTLYFYIKL